MCNCQTKNKIGKMNTKGIVSGVMASAVASAGAIAALEVGAMVPAETLSPEYTSMAKIAVGAILPSMVKGKSGEYLKQFGQGFAVQGALELYSKYVKGGSAVAGWDNSSYALRGGLQPIAGWDNASYALRGGLQPQATGPYSAGPEVVTA